ncbi:hypothetical protein U9M48_015952 [Paspalum notatum var. saurae]|uniref:Uncharacterized protein n=1 Tax=Paspalum notatum var. saurae TaxID=547442 RepID=A0AAQ3WMK2_PASNO
MDAFLSSLQITRRKLAILRRGLTRGTGLYILDDLTRYRRSPSERRADADADGERESETFLLTLSVVLSMASSAALAADSAACSTVSLPISRLIFAAPATDAGLPRRSYLANATHTRHEIEMSPSVSMHTPHVVLPIRLGGSLIIYRGSSAGRRSLKHASLAHARSASSQRSWPAMPIASSTGSRGGPCFVPPPPPGVAGAGAADSRNRSADAATSKTTTATMAAAMPLAARRAGPHAPFVPGAAAPVLFFLPLIVRRCRCG